MVVGGPSDRTAITGAALRCRKRNAHGTPYSLTSYKARTPVAVRRSEAHSRGYLVGGRREIGFTGAHRHRVCRPGLPRSLPPPPAFAFDRQSLSRPDAP